MKHFLGKEVTDKQYDDLIQIASINSKIIYNSQDNPIIDRKVAKKLLRLNQILLKSFRYTIGVKPQSDISKRLSLIQTKQLKNIHDIEQLWSTIDEAETGLDTLLLQTSKLWQQYSAGKESDLYKTLHDGKSELEVLMGTAISTSKEITDILERYL